MRRRQILAAEVARAAAPEFAQKFQLHDVIGGSLVPVKNACPKCMKVFPRGLHLHVKHCKA